MNDTDLIQLVWNELDKGLEQEEKTNTDLIQLVWNPFRLSFGIGLLASPPTNRAFS